MLENQFKIKITESLKITFSKEFNLTGLFQNYSM